jgi:hypothetical protein
MTKPIIITVLAAGLTFAILLDRPAAARQDQPDPMQQDGVEVLTRGPVHEAYAAPEGLDPKPTPIVPKAPPEPVPEQPPDEKPDGSHVVWISGYWAWDDDTAQYLWVSGMWRDTPPGKRWVPGHWLQVTGGWQWSPGLWTAETQTEVNYVPAPPPTLETGPSAAAPDANQFYSPGVWVYVDRKYRWRPGFWLKYRPNWVYVPAHFVCTPAGCIFVDGYWDYEITRRGLLFCPVRFTANVLARVGWRLRHDFIVYPEVLIGSLFVRLEYHRYCFGDYFGASYLGHGFIPWVDYRWHKNIPEPLFAQFAWAHRAEEHWERDLRKLYDDRRLNLVLRPPHTIVEQQRFMRDLAEHKAIKIGDKTFAFKDVKVAERNLLMVNTLAKVDRKVIPLRPLTPAARTEVLKTVEHNNAVRVERKTEVTKIIKESGPIKVNDAHQAVKLPPIPKHLETPATVVRPTATVVPAHIEREVPKYTPPAPSKASTKPLHHG